MTALQSQMAEPLRLNPTTAAALIDFKRRRGRLLMLRSIAAGLLALTVSMILVAALDYLWLLTDAVRWSLSLLAYAVTFSVVWWFGWRRRDGNDMRRIAKQFESADPRFNEQLLATVELADPETANGSPRFRQWLQDRTARHVAAVDVVQLLPFELIRPWLWTAAIVLATIGLMILVPQVQFGRRLARAILPGLPIERASLTKINITKPSPLSGTVAEGDAVGIVASIGGSGADDVRLQWRTAGGTRDEINMTPQTSTGADDNNVYSAILAVAGEPIEYRVTAGDGITLWHRLTPVPRPGVVSFSKRYVYPEYTGLASETIESDHGDLSAIQGSVAQLTARFNEPCAGRKDSFRRRLIVVGHETNGSIAHGLRGHSSGPRIDSLPSRRDQRTVRI